MTLTYLQRFYRPISLFFALLMVLTIISWTDVNVKADEQTTEQVTSNVPPMINYQGLIQTAGAPYNGTGYFKFALVDSANGNGAVTYWTNDGTATGEPATSVALTVNAGRFVVALGDRAIIGMTQPLSAAVFAQPAIYLRVWFSAAGTPGSFQPLEPNQRIVSVAYALRAQSAENARTSGQILFETVNVPGPGWYRVAHIDGLNGRGQNTVTVYTTGGEVGPRSTTIRWWHDREDLAAMIVSSEYGRGYWSAARITTDGNNSYLEILFTRAIPYFGLTMQYEGGYGRGELYDGTLPPGAGTNRFATRLGLLSINYGSLFIDDDGKIGVNTQSPGYTLDVNGTLAIQSEPILGYADGSLWVGDGPGAPRPHPLILRAGDAGRVWVTPQGNVGIGTGSPQAKLDVGGSMKVGGDVQVKGKTLTLNSLGRGCYNTGVYGLVYKVGWDPGGQGSESTDIQVQSSFDSLFDTGTGGEGYQEIGNPIRVCVTGGKSFADSVTIFYMPFMPF